MGLNHTECIFALRAHALALPAVAVASGTLAATSSGFSRADLGSFLNDGIKAGMELVPTGFANTTPALVLAVEDDTLTVAGGRTVQTSAPGRSLTFGFPPLIAWEGANFEESTATNRYYVDEDYARGPSSRSTLGRNALVEHWPTYFLALYSPPGYGVEAPYALADALVEHFAPDTVMVLPSGPALRVRGDPAPFGSQLTTLGAFSVITVTIPLWAQTANSI